jgi:hypothetical protein
MARQRWKDKDLYNLLNYPISKLVILYPEYTVGTLKGKKAYWKKKLNNGDIEMPNPENHEILEPFGLVADEDAIVNYHIGYIKNADGEIEYTRPLPSVKANQARTTKLESFISQAAPLVIRSVMSKPVERDYKLIFAFGDSQIDYREINNELIAIHDERALRVARFICKVYQPDVIVNLGDTIDLAALSRFPADSDHFKHSLNPAFNRVHRMYAELRADNPNAEIHEVDSNHNTRLGKFILRQVPELYGIQQAGVESSYPVLTYPFFANLDALDVTWHSGYGAAEYVYGKDYDAPPIVFKHGNTVVSAGSTASKESKENPETHVVRGHGHRIESHWRTTRSGLYLASHQLGCTCSIDGDVPSYHSAIDDRGNVVKRKENWQQGVMMITDYMNGQYQFDQIPIINGKAYYEGREFDGNE